MANWYGTARTNYVRFKDEAAYEAAKELVESCGNTWHRGEQRLVAMISGDDDSGGFNFSRYDEDAEKDVDIAWEDVAKHLDDDQVLVCMEVGAEKLRYVSGHTSAWNNKGESVELSLRNIYKLAFEKFGVAPTEARYTDEPEPVASSSQAPREGGG
jgi:hypothetical protein